MQGEGYEEHINFTFSIMGNYFAVQFAVFVYVTVIYVKMPQCNFSDEIVN